ncbi:MAG: sialate O-acetylesterase [Planctomycetota bacterium]
MNSRLALFRFVFVIALAATSAAPQLFADVSLPSLFSDHMVLQQDVPVPVWGWAVADEEVSVTINGQTKSVKAGADGKWSLKLDALKAGEPTTLVVKGKNTLTINDVLIGEVWLCSGQSNMGFHVSGADNFEKEKAAANYPKLRHFTVTSMGANEPKEKCTGAWVVCAPDTVGTFSATAYFFGREVHLKSGQAVGLINSSVGGTAIEAWTSMDAQKDKPELKPLFEGWKKKQADYSPEKSKAAYEKQLAAWTANQPKLKADGKAIPRKPILAPEPIKNTSYPANLFNGKINPLVPYAIRGAIWYQGEHNAGNPEIAQHYGLQMSTLITDWRARWGSEFSFGIVQLPDFHAAQKEPSEHVGWVMVREGMLKTLSLPKTGMAVTLGCGMPENIHPTNKQEVGRRLGSWALADVYGKKEFAAFGPLPSGHQINGAEVTISFTHTDGGLVAKDGGELKGFAIAGEDKKFVWAKAKIVGDKVVVSSPDVPKPAAVRYAWAANPQFNLFNGAGLAATPFRTDEWK